MEEIIKVKDDLYKEYEDLLITRDELKQEQERYYAIYMHEFGEHVAEIFKLKIESIRLKKMIAFCQKKANFNQPINYQELMDSIEEVMKSYNDQLHALIQDVQDCKDLKRLSEGYVLRVKRVYRRIALKIHPDANPKLFQYEEIQELWQRTTIAYRAHDLIELEGIEVLVNKVLNTINDDSVQLDIEELPSKIIKIQEEIKEIKSTNPYQYKYLLEDKESKEEKTKELEEELKEYKDYIVELNKVLDQFDIVKVVS